jgi:hypothetical protein
MAALNGIIFFRARKAYKKAGAEALIRWPHDLDVGCPGDAGPLGELALALED